MIAAIMKIGTMPTGAYWIKERKNRHSLHDFCSGDRIAFKPQMVRHSQWEYGIITGWSKEIPLIERI